ncbi:DUF4397 domain-containing protein [Streptomyces sp. SL13]|uniref:DUF4397 domain-containing protein n=1 Tax=Streptantibioticus silvisoli TaxID=2705255 RepID=A0AA90H0Y8_9ACTN|nr:DUF4397 domain-containing protein [Streptantibioticus silvisoli]MDI5971289.1 DUF4397 domain-containing protein [Streptantibioticus silvisoli]
MNKLARTTLALGASGLLSLGAVAPAAATPHAASAGTAKISVFHGIPGMTVDVYANGKKMLSDLKPGSLTQPTDLPQGTYDIKVLRAGSAPGSSPLLQRSVDVTSGSNSTLVANLNPGGQPALNAFSNDVSAVPAGKARLTVRHVAAAPAVDVKVNGGTVFKDLKNPGQAQVDVPAGTINTSVVLTGTDKVVLGPSRYTVTAGSNTVVYAWGSANNRDLALKVQSLAH